MRRALVIAALALGLGTLLAQEAPAPEAAPKLTAEQRLQAQNKLQKLEIAQLHVQMAQAEAEQATREASAYIQTLMVPGWKLDLARLEYAKLQPADKAEPKK